MKGERAREMAFIDEISRKNSREHESLKTVREMASNGVISRERARKGKTVPERTRQSER